MNIWRYCCHNSLLILSISSEEAKISDVSNSTGMQLLQKMISLERNESGKFVSRQVDSGWQA